MSGSLIRNVASPSISTDAATKEYVDAAMGGTRTLTYVGTYNSTNSTTTLSGVDTGLTVTSGKGVMCIIGYMNSSITWSAQTDVPYAIKGDGSCIANSALGYNNCSLAMQFGPATTTAPISGTIDTGLTCNSTFSNKWKIACSLNLSTNNVIVDKTCSLGADTNMDVAIMVYEVE